MIALKLETDAHGYVILSGYHSFYADIIFSPGINAFLLSSPTTYFDTSDKEFSPFGFRLGYTGASLGRKERKSEKKVFYSQGYTIEIGAFPSIKNTGFLLNLHFYRIFHRLEGMEESPEGKICVAIH